MTKKIILPIILLILPSWVFYLIFRQMNTNFPLGIAPIILYTFFSIIAFIFYVFDKHQAKKNNRRIPELYLHLIEFCGGWFGAFLAQVLVHHKSSKTSYQIIFWIIVAIHQCLCLAYLYYFTEIFS